MRPDLFFCSQLSGQVAEKIHGTASTGDVWLLLEYPYPWGAHVLPDSSLSPEVKAFLTAALKTIPRSRLLFIKRDHRQPEHLSLFIVRTRDAGPTISRLQFNDYDEILGLNTGAILAGDLPPGAAPWNEPTFLVCTHGKRDKCCAKFGYPLYKALREHDAGSVWQSSHVGGDRFAGNLVCFPHGLFYAHVDPESGITLVNEYRRGEVVLDYYRGRACYAHPVQAAEFFIRSESAITGADALRYLGQERLGEKSWLVRFAGSGGGPVYEAGIIGRLSGFATFITCHAVEEKRVVQYELDSYRVSAATLERS